MTVQTLKLAGKKFVLLEESDYKQLKAKATRPATARKARKSFQQRQDEGDIAEAIRRRNEPALPYSKLRKELGLE